MVERFLLTNILSVDCILQNCLYVCPLQHWGEIDRRSQRFLLSKGAENVCPLGPLTEWETVLFARPRVIGPGPVPIEAIRKTDPSVSEMHLELA